jgi:hypothetical protein
MTRENAGWAMIGFLVALMMGAAAAPSVDVGRWQLRFPDDPEGTAMITDSLLFDTATGSIWACTTGPLGGIDGTPAERIAKIRKSWTEVGPIR